MLRRDGNVIGSPIETTQSSGTGVFRISASQQKTILTKFPEHVELPEKPLFVSCLRGRTPHFPETTSSTSSPTGRTPSSALQTGQILIRIASPKNWEARVSSAYSTNVLLEEERDYAGKANIIGYSVEITMANTGTHADGVGGDFTPELSYQFLENGVLTNATRSAFGTIFLPIEDNIDCEFRHNRTNLDFRIASRTGTPFEDEDNVFNIILNDVTAGPVNRTGNTGLRGMPKDAYYSIRVFAENEKGASVSATESNEIDCTYDFATTSRYLLFRDYGSAFGGYPYPVRPPGSYYLDFMIIGGGGSGGNAYAYGTSGGGGAGAMVIGYGVRLKKNERTYNITIGTGGVNGNGGDTSAFGCIAVGGGRGGSTGRVATASTTYYVSAAQAGGCGGGAVSGVGASAGLMLTTNSGFTGAMVGNTSGASYAVGDTEFDQGLLNVYENVGGGFLVSAGDALRSVYSEQLINALQAQNTFTEAHGGGGVGGPGNMNRCTSIQGSGGPGKYIAWATPGISSLIPQVGRTAQANSCSYDTVGGSKEQYATGGVSGQIPSAKGFFGGGGSGFDQTFMMGVGGGGVCTFENNQYNQTIDGFTYSAAGVHGLGAGGGGRRTNDNNRNNDYLGHNGGDGICIIRMAASAHDPNAWGDTFRDYYAMSATGSYQATVVGTYIYYIFDGDGTFGPKGRAGIVSDGN